MERPCGPQTATHSAGRTSAVNARRALFYKALIFKEIKDSLDAIPRRTANDVALFNPSTAGPAQVSRPAGLARLAPHGPQLDLRHHPARCLPPLQKGKRSLRATLTGE